MIEWITDRLPTKDDAKMVFPNGYTDPQVWVMLADTPILMQWMQVQPGQPWMPITIPEPYVKKNRCQIQKEINYDGKEEYTIYCNCCIGPVARRVPNRAVAEQIANIYNEVMP